MSTNENQSAPAEDSTEPATPVKLWSPLTRFQRRVAGVLIEKSKTTPDIYPMTINGIKTAANQKSNRSPQLDMREEQVEETLYELRKKGAVIEVHSGGRVPKFKHQLYEWLGVEKVELAVMAELLLRGEQSIGDLRGRASRMDRIEGVSELKPILANLIEKGLVIELTPSGRGQIVTHYLYQSDELERLKNQHGNYVAGSQADDAPPRRATSEYSSDDPSSGSNQSSDSEVQELRQEIAELRQSMETLKLEIAEIRELLSGI